MKEIQYVFMDIDGVLYRGQYPINGAKEFIDYLIQQEIKFICVTNNSAKTPADYSKRLKDLGINIGENEIINSGVATVEFLKDTYLKEKDSLSAYVVGGDGLMSLIKNSGIKIQEKNPDIVIVGWDITFTYEKMKKASLAIQNGAIYIGTNPDLTYPSHEGILPGCGAILASITAASGVEPIIIGKPKSLIMEMASKRISAKKEKSLMIGDRIDTDILAGRNFGIQTALVLSGVVDRSELSKSHIKPDYVFEDMMDLYINLKESRKV
ncbi:MAG: UMP phosphatase [Candidatus Methanofastidiosum methylothiophilum]|uniref:UMP phosphatase n=1 Tax=Candidatus Methanofastidiosum methylothiophilum TaxID=1705564 RepID=A0A150ISE7_9EURY|nr:MAG: UMP phosphatase [Candidatus Methanofastidiosum methylthiophilus]KYC47959.1 MAG: UMP phosphatase [Candidatus Methanofastidiosum methylthiophilus]KYC50577.1 MAG: UMP phosphatase [Candidatus Methanofastidiosum methylthiophilus]